MMPFCSFSGSNPLDGFTSLENMFIFEYMPGAPAEFVKVYLYMRMLCAYPGYMCSAEDIASALHTDDTTITNALKYWEREGLIQKMSDNPPSYDLLPLFRKSQKEVLPGDSVYTDRSFNRDLQSRMPGLIIDSHELRMANDWQDIYGLDRDAVLYLVECEMAKYSGRQIPTVQTVFKHLELTAREWGENGIKTRADATEYVAQNSIHAACAAQVIKQFGQRRKPSVDEISLVRKWMDEWNYTNDVIIGACSETVKSSSPSFAYLDKILETRLNGDSDDESRARVKLLCSHLGIPQRPTPSQIEALESFLKMGFEFAAVEQAAKWCGENNRRTFDDISRKLEVWRSAGAFTIQAIEDERKRINSQTAIVERIFSAAGIDRKITNADRVFASVWTALLGIDTVLVAAEFSMGTETPMKYIDKLVKSWSASGINTPEKARNNAQTAKQSAQNGKPMLTRSVSEDEFDNDSFSDIMNRKPRAEAEQ